MAYTDGVPSPELFRQWSAIGTVSAALERRTWVEAARRILYPNLFVLLVGPPGSGKTEAITPTRELLRGAKKFKIAPNDVSKASLIDSLIESDRKIILPNNRLLEYHSLAVQVGEFGVLISAHDLGFLSVINDLFDNPPEYGERKRHHAGGKERIIVHPQLNILAGVQPLFLASLLPEEAWGQGFTSRLIMVYAETSPQVDLFGADDISASPLKRRLMDGLVTLSSLIGRWYWESDAGREIVRWVKSGMDPVPEHSRLAYYNSRRVIHMLKLCAVSAASRVALYANGTPSMSITLGDVSRARDWLLHAEQLMPDIFRGMVQQSDAVVIREMHQFMWKLWARTKQPVHESALINFLYNRLPHEKILRVIEVAERANIIARQAGSKMYIPLSSDKHGVE